MPMNSNLVVPVLSQIRLKNFKSVKEAAVDLKQLTVVVGKNSSGKSTLLQSILVLSQAVERRGQSRQFPLNGELVKLGSFAEVKNFSDSSANGEILVGFTLSQQRRSQTFRSMQSSEPFLRCLSWDGHLSSPQDLGNGFSTIDAVQMRIEDFIDGMRTNLIDVDISKISGEIETNDQRLFNPIDWRSVRVGETVVKVDGRIFNGITGDSASIDLVSLSGGLPEFLFQADSRINAYAQIWWDKYSQTLEIELEVAKKKHAETLSEGKGFVSGPFAIKQATDDIRSFTKLLQVGDRERDNFQGGPRSRLRVQDYFSVKSAQLSEEEKKNVAEQMVAMQEATFRTELRKKFKEAEWAEIVHLEISDSHGEQLFTSIRNIYQAFSQGVKYLGPLRQAPKPLYDPGPEKDDLGIYGEYTAGVLYVRSQQSRKDLYPLPDGGSSRVTFMEALNLWLQHLDLVENAFATDRGRLGIGLEVVPKGISKSVDLTSVGVGVSQVLPVLVLCLITKPGKLVVIEQPELHLHPAMQLKLADFLLACVKTGRQIIVETHSEHIVNRLRLRSMESPDENSKLIRLLFAEQEEGNTVYRSSDVNDLGGLDEDWPEGFLDVGANEAASFMRASIGKMREKKQTK